MNELIFKNEEFGGIRVIREHNAHWFVGSDVADILGYANTKDAILSHVDEEDRCIIQRSENTTFDIPNRGLTVINESGLYSLILRSKLPTARRFKRWVTSEVLPAIRKDGGYISAHETETPEQIMAKALQIADATLRRQKEQIGHLEEENEHLVPLAAFAEAVASSEDSILVREFAKILQQSGIPLGANRLFEWLRTNGYLVRSHSSDWNKPTQKSSELGVMELRTTLIHMPSGEVKVRNTPRITGKGQTYFHKKLKRIYENETETSV